MCMNATQILYVVIEVHVVAIVGCYFFFWLEGEERRRRGGAYSERVEQQSREGCKEEDVEGETEWRQKAFR